jgi:peroxiredoxin
MRRRTVIAVALSLGIGPSAFADTPAARVGVAAPAFVALDSDGRRVSSQALLGKIVVLEWTNPECPYVDKHYSSGSMQALQREATANGIVWLTISSAVAGNVGYLDALEGAELVATRKASPTHLLLDHDGRMLSAYGVTVALTMAVIDANGVLAYFGAIDDKPTAKLSDIPGARNFVRDALAAIASGQPVKPSQTRPYGCVAR